MVTMREIAREAGCSVATVSRALSGGARVEDAMGHKIREVATRLGYQPRGRAARADAETPTHTVGLLIPTLEKFNYTLSMSLMQHVLARAGYQLLLGCHEESTESETALLRRLLAHRVDAIVHVPSGRAGAPTLLGEAPTVPIVEFYRRSADRDVDAVVADDRLGSYELVRHLVEYGHDRIALIADDSEHSTSVSRAGGFSRAIAEADLPIEQCPMLFRPLDEPTRGQEWGALAFERIVSIDPKRRPTAVVCTSTHVALGVVEAAHRLGVAIPDEASIVVFSSAEWLDVCEPPLTRYQIPLKEMGLMAAQLVLNRLDLAKGPELESSSITFAGKLVVRSSVAKPNKAERAAS